MKILHCCLAAVYIDNYGYQENILPKMHVLQGHEVMILASTETFIDQMNLGYVEPSFYHTESGIPIHRIGYIQWLPHIIAKKLRIYVGLSKIIRDFNPDILFLHDAQFISIIEIVNYAKMHKNVTIYIDGHTDFINSAKNWISKNILHKLIYKPCLTAIAPYTKKFYGVLPLRVDFFIDEYGIDPEKVELLVMGGDLTNIKFDCKDEIRRQIRNELNVNESDFLIISGGKIDWLKNVHLLMKAVNTIANSEIKLVVFGSVSSDLKEQIESMSSSKFVKFIGWKSSDELSNYFLASDLAFFPGTHSVLWEQSAALGLPGIFKKWNGIQHMDVGGNCIFLEEITVEKIAETINTLFNNKEQYNKMRKVAVDVGIANFSYYEIAKRAIE